jgi:hypothetical protein
VNQIDLPGIDAQNPLGFFAALGLLKVLDFDASARGVASPLLQFRDEGAQVPCIHTELDLDAMVQLVLDDAAAEADNPALALAYDKTSGNLVPREGDVGVRDLKPSPAAAREFLSDCSRRGRRVADLAASFFSELVQDRTKGNTKPTALHFAAGQQQFLSMVGDIRSGIRAEDVRHALLGPWRSESKLPSLSWDSSVSRMYALRARDPSSEKRGSMPAAYWLGVQGLSFFPVTVCGQSLVTTAVVGGWKDSVFTWPTWGPALATPTIAALLRMDCRRLKASQRSAYGLTHVFASQMLRSDQGGYGSFAPAAVVGPSQR